MSNEIVKGMTIVDFLSIYREEFRIKFNERRDNKIEDYKKGNGYYYDIGKFRELFLNLLKLIADQNYTSNHLSFLIDHNKLVKENRKQAYIKIKEIKTNVGFRKRNNIKNILENTPKFKEYVSIPKKEVLNSIKEIRDDLSNLLTEFKKKWIMNYNYLSYRKTNSWAREIIDLLSDENKNILNIFIKMNGVISSLFNEFRYTTIKCYDVDVFGDRVQQYTNFDLFWKQLQGECVDMNKKQVLELFSQKYNIDEITNEGF